MVQRLCIFILFFFCLSAGKGQNMLHLEIIHTDMEDEFQVQFKPETFPDSISLVSKLQLIINNLQKKGYLLAKVDSFVVNNKQYKAYLYSGPLFHWQLLNSNVDKAILQELNLDNFFSEKDIIYPDLSFIKKKLITYYENKGYPFARVYLDHIEIKGNIIFGELIAETNEYFTFEDLHLEGNVSAHPGFLANHSGVRRGKPYSHNDALVAGESIADLPFVSITGKPMLVFYDRRAKLSVPVQARRANRFDGLAGLSGSGTDADPYRIAGLINLHLMNSLERGEIFDLKWQGSGHGTQRLELMAQYPYLFSSPFITGFLFSLHKQDSSYISLRRRPEFSYRAFSNVYISAYADFRSTHLLNPSRYSFEGTLPSRLDTRVTFYGMEIKKQTAGFMTNFRQGNSIAFSMAAGTRNIKINNLLDPSLYKDINLQQNQITTTFSAIFQNPLSANISYVTKIETSGLFSKQLFENELFRIGGFSSLKGFDEESIFASAYSIFTQEMRFFTGEMSFVNILFNIAWFEENIQGMYQKGWPWGIGAGVNLSTAPGILSVYYALGKYPGTPLSFQNARLHFGFISLF